MGIRIMSAAEGIAHEAWIRNNPNLHAVAGYLMWICGDRGTCGLETKAVLMLDQDNRMATTILQLLQQQITQTVSADMIHVYE
ncbi:hypothetical protein JS528_00370 [Bifidobacterium sp. MA2]|uniref:Uncharacterized protein n=1 Tax=Bifidobacterium santillanense TaxID=2809028 RepID=A0ABS5UM04_9BIFI|nr:hypothetical protein [Bifidobacterium santillanense]MBT1171835.1 hypothetical protein [Bifidobacterium santillanense]